MQQIPQITYCVGKNERGKKVYKLSHNVCVQTCLHQQLGGNQFISLDNEGLLTIREGYSWNGMTKYRDSKNTMFSTLVHDALYKLMRVDLSKDSNENRIDDRSKFREGADNLFQCHCQINGVKCYKSLMFYYAVRAFAVCRSNNTNFSYTVKRKIVNNVTAPANGSVKCR